MCTYRFPELLRQLDDSKQRLGVASYGLAVTTLEEVFLKVSLQQGGSDSGSNHQVWGMLSHFVVSSLPLFFTLLLQSVVQTRATPNGMSFVDSMMLLPPMMKSCLFPCLVEVPRPMQRTATPDAHPETHTQSCPHPACCACRRPLRRPALPQQPPRIAHLQSPR